MGHKNTSSPFWTTCTPLLMSQTARGSTTVGITQRPCVPKEWRSRDPKCGTQKAWRNPIFGTPVGSPEVRSGGRRETIGRRTEIVGRSPKRAGFAGSVADPLAVGGFEVPSCVADIATITVRSVRPRTRLGDGAGDEHIVGTSQEIDRSQQMTHNIASLPMRMGGLGLRRALRMAPAAHGASWAVALHMIHQRLPVVADRVVHKLSGREDAAGCLSELRGVATELDRQGFVGRPEWRSSRMGVRPQGIFQAEPGEWPRGWQYHASSSSEHTFRKNVVLDQSCAADQAHLQSHSGPGASDALSVCPSKPEFRIEAGLFRTLILERLRLPLQVTEKVCECGIALDSTGRHRAACNRSGRLKTRALAREDLGQGLPRTRSNSTLQCDALRHESCSVGQ